MAVNVSTPQRATRISFSGLGNLWRWLTEPAEAITGSEHRRRARLLAALLVFLIPLGISASTAPALIQGDPDYSYLEDPVYIASVIGTVGLIAAYGLGRTKRYVWGAVLTLTIIPVLAFAAVISVPGDAGHLLDYMALVMLLSSLLLSVQGTVVTVLAVLAGILVLPGLSAGLELTSPTIISAILFNSLMGALMVVGSIVRSQDLMQIERQSRELAAAVREAEQANKLKDQFLANMSHELRTPLNAIIGFTEVMMMGLTGTLPQRADHAISRIHLNSERLLTLIDDVLDISKIEAGRREIVKQPFEPGDLLSFLDLDMKRQADSKGLELVTVLDPDLPTKLIGDTRCMEQILSNLVSNAIKFTEEGRITVSLERLSPEEWAIIVKDTGVGIPAHAQEYIFEKFRQVDGTSRRAYSGSGLGLAIVRELALLMDGNIKVQSRPGIGSTFTVTLPLLEPERQARG